MIEVFRAFVRRALSTDAASALDVHRLRSAVLPGGSPWRGVLRACLSIDARSRIATRRTSTHRAAPRRARGLWNTSGAGRCDASGEAATVRDVFRRVRGDLAPREGRGAPDAPAREARTRLGRVAPPGDPMGSRARRLS